MENDFGIKELYEACFKTTNTIAIGNQVFEPGEPILYFENLNVAKITGDTDLVAALGGKQNSPLIIWEDSKPVSFQLESGLLSHNSFSLLTGVRALTTEAPVIIPKNEMIHTDWDGKATLFATPRSKSPKFFYLISQGLRTKFTDYTIENGVITTSYIDSDIFASYYFAEPNGETFYSLGQDKINGVFAFEAKTYYKDIQTGTQRTCVIDLPRVKIQSGLNIMLGSSASPIVSTFNMISVPDSGRRESMKFYYLNRDIDFDL